MSLDVDNIIFINKIVDYFVLKSIWFYLKKTETLIRQLFLLFGSGKFGYFIFVFFIQTPTHFA